MNASFLLEYGLTAGLGAILSAGELLSRYRDSPRRLFKLPSAYGYMIGNGSASALTLVIARANELPLGGAVNEVLLCGVGAMVILRSAFANVRIGERDVSVGPAAVVQSILGTLDRVIDRNQATTRSTIVSELMKGISFAKAYEALPEHCLYLMANAPPDDATRLSAAITKIFESDYTDQVKAFNLGVVLLDFAGEQVLKGAVKTLGDEITA